MPIINPFRSEEVLRAAQKEVRKISKKETLETLLENNRLTPDDALRVVEEIMTTGETEQSRLRAGELALKLNGLLQNDAQASIPSVTIVINDSQYTSVNPILLPRNLSNELSNG